MANQVLFVGSGPSSKNIDPAVPFVGTTSYRRLLEWIMIMELDVSDVQLANVGSLKINSWLDDRGFDYFEVFNHWGMSSIDRIIALGRDAERYLVSQGVENYFRLPHPSGRNRLLNDKKFVKQELSKCKKFIKGEKHE